MRHIIIGASGTIGREVLALGHRNGVPCIGTCASHAQPGLLSFDMRTDSIVRTIPDLGPGDCVHLLSAYSNPSWIFQHQEEAQRLNVDATIRCAREALKVGARLVFMSSVEVFDGRVGAYSETSQPAPLNVYGRMKRVVECALIEEPRACVMRTSWNVGWTLEHRCVVKLTYESLLGDDPRMATDNTFSIADVRDTARALLLAGEQPSIRCLHAASPTVWRRSELADLIIANSRHGHSMRYTPCVFAQIPYSEPRARLNDLDASQASKQWGLRFRDAREIVLEKVRLLDAHMEVAA